MRFYAKPSWRLTRQITADVFVLGWTIVWFLTGRLTDGVIRGLAEPARQVARLGTDAERQLGEAATRAGGVPVVGDGLRQPFVDLGGTVTGMVASANEQVASIELVATVAGWLVFLIPWLTLVALWLPRRLAFANRARGTLALAATADGQDLLALRALATQPPSALNRVGPDPVAAWRSADPAVIERLADLELATAGVGRPRRRRPTTLAP